MRSGMRLLAALLALILVLVVAGLWLVQQQVSAAGVDRLDWQGVGWADGALHIERVSASYIDTAGSRLDIEASDLLVEPVWAKGPALGVLQIERLQMDWQPQVALPEARSTAMPDVQQLVDNLRWLPKQQLAIDQIAVSLPCGTRTCSLDGGLQVEREQGDRLRLYLELLAKQGTIRLEGFLHPDSEGLQADLKLHLNNAEAAGLQAQWLYGSAAPSSQGVLGIPGWPQSDWLLDYAQPWLGVQPPITTLPTGLQGEIRWRLAPLQRPETASDLLDGAVELKVDATLADPWTLPQLGSVASELKVDLLGDDGLWQIRQARAQMRLTEPLLPALVDLPAQVRPQSLMVEVTAQADSTLAWSETLALLVDAQVTGPVTGRFTGPLSLVSRPQWSAQWEALQLRASSEQLRVPSGELRQLDVAWTFAGRADERLLELEFAPGARVNAAQIRLPDLVTLSGVRADLTGLKLQIPMDQPAAATLDGPLSISAGRLEHAALKPQGWTVRGGLTRDTDGMRWAGSVVAASELELGVSFVWPVETPWRADLRLEPTFLRAADPLSATLQAWPELLTLGRGRLQGQLSLHGDPQLKRVDGRLELDGAAGIYDRMSFTGLGAVVGIDLAGDRLQLNIPALTLEALDPGIPMGPLAANLNYAAHVERLAKGSLRVEQAQLQMLGGQLTLQPTVLDLGAQRQRLVVDIRGLELDRLFAVYPAEGLRGRGTLDGQLPVALVDGELMIEAGEVGARAPGGFLQYRSDKLADLAETTPGMRQVAQALDDFQYDLLNADVTYGDGGILVLGLQLQGSNPALEDGRPIHLNIRLEEDIPALLASLQLSGKVSDVIQQRIKQRLLKQQADP